MKKAVRILVPLLLSLAAIILLDTALHRRAVKRLDMLFSGKPVYVYEEGRCIDSVRFEDLHHLDILSNLADSADIVSWTRAYRNIEWIWPYLDTVWQYHVFSRDTEGNISEFVNYPIKYGTYTKPFSEEDFLNLVRIGQNALDSAKRFLIRDYILAERLDRYSLNEFISNRYYCLIIRPKLPEELIAEDNSVRLGFDAYCKTEEAKVFITREYVGHYRIGRRWGAEVCDFVLLSLLFYLLLSSLGKVKFL